MCSAPKSSGREYPLYFFLFLPAAGARPRVGRQGGEAATQLRPKLRGDVLVGQMRSIMNKLMTRVGVGVQYLRRV